MEIQYKNILLRDMLESDIEDYVRWFTSKGEWARWDAPWEQEDSDEASERERWTRYYHTVCSLPVEELRWRLEIEADGKHVGWVSSYLMDERFTWIAADSVKEGQQALRAVGIDLCEDSVWGKGVGSSALAAFIQYFFDRGLDTIYTQTWSGNERMVHVAQKLGFTECSRFIGIREVNGKHYDALTFQLQNRPI